MRVDLDRAIRQLEAKSEQSSRGLCLGGEHIHAGFRNVEQDTIQLASVGKRDFNGRLYWNAESSAALATEKTGRRSQTNLGRLLGERFVQHEMSAPSQNCPYVRRICYQGNA